MDYKFYKEKVGDTIFWVENNDCPAVDKLITSMMDIVREGLN